MGMEHGEPKKEKEETRWNGEYRRLEGHKREITKKIDKQKSLYAISRYRETFKMKSKRPWKKPTADWKAKHLSTKEKEKVREASWYAIEMSLH